MKKRLLRHVHHRLLIFKSLFDGILLLLVFSLSWLSHSLMFADDVHLFVAHWQAQKKNHLGNPHSQEPFSVFFRFGQADVRSCPFFFPTWKTYPTSSNRNSQLPGRCGGEATEASGGEDLYPQTSHVFMQDIFHPQYLIYKYILQYLIYYIYSK